MCAESALCRYGGSIAIAGGGITVGSLIKYQLYWNMINNAWQVYIYIYVCVYICIYICMYRMYIYICI